MATTGKVIRKGKRFSITEASPDHPIYKRGFVVGGHYSRRSSSATKSTSPPSENAKPQTGKR